MITSISLEKALEILNFNSKENETEELQLMECLKKRASKDVYSQINNPPFNKSAMDGYAIKVSLNKKYEVIGTLYAGSVYKGEIKENEAVKIMTGAKIPEGLDAVIKKEDVIVDGDYIVFDKEIKRNENICFLGEDISKNQILIQKGKKINFADIGILSSCGVKKVSVYKETRIGFLTTGDEVVDIDKSLDDGKIYNSNKYSILARLEELGYTCKVIDHAKDDKYEIANKIKEMSKNADVIVTTGGASVGDKDLLEDAIEYLGGINLFKKINIKPGSAVLASMYNDSIILSLSGNPNAALTTFELLAKPALEKLGGNEDNSIKREVAILANDFNKKSNVRRFLRGRAYIEDGKQFVQITQVKSGNGILSSVIDSNCLIEIDKGKLGLKASEEVQIIKI